MAHANARNAERPEIAIRPGVTIPDWSVVTSSIVRHALEAIFETCGWSERWSELDEDEHRTRCAILQSYARTGHAPSSNDLALATGFELNRVNVLIAKLAARDMVVLGPESSAIIGAYPFVDRPTEHRVYLRDTVLNAMCAIDALGIGAMLGTDVRIRSACRFCSTPIDIQTSKEGAALTAYAPTKALVWTGIQYANNCAADSLCSVMAFFCSTAHLDAWLADQDTEPTGYRLSMEEGLELGKAIFMPRLAGDPSSQTPVGG